MGLKPEKNIDAVEPSEAGTHRNDEELQKELINKTVSAIKAHDFDEIPSLLEHLHEADLADLFEILDGSHRKILAKVLENDMEPDVLAELEGVAREDVISVLEPSKVAQALTQMETDDAVEVLEEMEEEEQQEILGQIPHDDRAQIEEGLSYPEDSAGRLMQRDLVAVPPYYTVGQTIDGLRENSDLPDQFWEIFVVDPQHKPVGTMALNVILKSNRDVKTGDIMQLEQTLIPVEMDQEEVAYLFQQYNLVSAAVVDSNDRLVGMITVDDIVDVIEEEAEEDLLALGGVKEGDVNVSVREISKTRFGWLLVNLITAILASVVIGLFGATIEELVALAVLMPIVASMGGNAATQTMTVAVRALATRELTSSNAFRVVWKEMLVNFYNGILLAIITGFVAWFWFGSQPLGLVIGAAMVINMFVAGLAGTLVPIGLDKLNIDPAVASSVFVTTITDVIGFFAFLGLAALWLL